MIPRAVSVTTATAVLLWQTVTGDKPLPTTTDQGVTVAAGRYRSGTFNQPLAIVVANEGTFTAFLGTSAVTVTDGLPLAAGAKLAFNQIGEDSLYAISTGGTTSLRVLVGEAAR